MDRDGDIDEFVAKLRELDDIVARILGQALLLAREHLPEVQDDLERAGQDYQRTVTTLDELHRDRDADHTDDPPDGGDRTPKP